MNQLISAVGAEDVAASSKKILGQNWLDLSKSSWIREKIGKNKAKFRQR